jgi:hypothetical protein
MQHLDAQILAEVRALLERRWIDLSQLRLGTTNGVVYVDGVLRPRLEARDEGAGERLRDRVKREIESIAGVREVILATLAPGEGKEPWRSAPMPQ